MRLLGYSLICNIIALFAAACLDFMDGLICPVPDFMHRLCEWNFSYRSKIGSNWAWKRRASNVVSRRPHEPHLSSENLVLSNDYSARDIQQPRLWCNFAPYGRLFVFLLYGVTIGILVSSTLVP